MCWDYQVSLGFSILYLIINSYYLFKKPRYWKEYLMFGMFYFTMEVFQTMQWLHGNVYMLSEFRNQNITIQGIKLCDTINSRYTVFAHILIWLQPILFSYIGYRTTSESNKKYSKYLLLVGIVVLIHSLVLLYFGSTKNNYYNIDDSIFGLSTCTNQGNTGHLVWKFKPASIDYFPNYFTYLVMCILAFLLYDKLEVKIIGYGWLVSCILTKLILRPTLIEVASSWCLLSIIANLMIYIYLQLKN